MKLNLEADVKTFSDVVLHQGLYELVHDHSHPGPSNPVNITSDGKLIITEELTRNRIDYLSLMTVLGKDFSFGRITFPEAYRKAYSPIGRSLNDICLRSRKSYCKETKEPRFGYIYTGFDATSDVQTEVDNVEFLNIRDDYCLAAGVIE